MANELIAVRIHPWQAFRLRRYATEVGQHEGLVVTDALKIFFAMLNLPAATTERWLTAYRADVETSLKEADKDVAHEVD